MTMTTRIDEAFFADDCEFALPEPPPAPATPAEHEHDATPERVG